MSKKRYAFCFICRWTSFKSSTCEKLNWVNSITGQYSTWLTGANSYIEMMHLKWKSTERTIRRMQLFESRTFQLQLCYTMPCTLASVHSMCPTFSFQLLLNDFNCAKQQFKCNRNECLHVFSSVFIMCAFVSKKKTKRNENRMEMISFTENRVDCTWT